MRSVSIQLDCSIFLRISQRRAPSHIKRQDLSYRTMCQDLDKAQDGFMQWHFKGRCIDSDSHKYRHASENIRPAYDSPLCRSLFECNALLPVTLMLPGSSRSFQMVVLFRKWPNWVSLLIRIGNVLVQIERATTGWIIHKVKGCSPHSLNYLSSWSSEFDLRKTSFKFLALCRLSFKNGQMLHHPFSGPHAICVCGTHIVCVFI